MARSLQVNAYQRVLVLFMVGAGCLAAAPRDCWAAAAGCSKKLPARVGRVCKPQPPILCTALSAAPADKTGFLCPVLRHWGTNGFIGEVGLPLKPSHSDIGTVRDAGTEMIIRTQALRMAPTDADTDTGTGTNTPVTVR